MTTVRPTPSRRAFLTAAAASVGVAGVAACTPPALVDSRVKRASAPQELRVRQPIPSDRQGFNRRWYAPALAAVYVPRGLDDVAAHVEDALRTYGSGVRVTSGRHGYESFVYSEDTRAIIDMSSMNQVGRDVERDTYFVDAGCENWTVYRTLLNGFGLTLPAGSCYSVGAGGHISGGGYGLLSRLHGLTIDHLVGVEIVTWDEASGQATLRYVSDSSSDVAERDLFWALRGAGGGNFGIIARYHFADLPVAPTHASIFTLAWDWADLTEANFARLLAEYADLVANLPPEEFTLLKLNHSAAGQIGLIWQRAAPKGVALATHTAQSEACVARLAQQLGLAAQATPLTTALCGSPGFLATHPKHASAQHFTYLEALQTLNGSGANKCGKYKSSYLTAAMPSEQVAAAYEWLNTVPEGLDRDQMAESLVQIDSYGGAVNQVASEATAVPQRSSLLKLQYQTYWANDAAPGEALTAPQQAQSEGHLAWIRGFYEQTYAAHGGVPDPSRDARGVVDGCYYNYPDVDLGTHEQGTAERALTLYFGDNLRTRPRNLVAVKRRWDSANTFRHSQSIPVE